MKPGFTTLHLSRALSGAVSGVFGRLAARPARLLLCTSGVQQKAFALATLLGLSAAAFAATPPNSPISNTATATYGIGANNLSATSTATVNTATCIDVGIKIELLQYLPPARAALAPAGSRTETVQQTGYAPGGALAGRRARRAVYPAGQPDSTRRPGTHAAAGPFVSRSDERCGGQADFRVPAQ